MKSLRSVRSVGGALVLPIALSVCHSAPDGASDARPPAPALSCPTGPAVASEGGVRRLALVVGVGQYESEGIPDLDGPAGDARRLADLLTGPRGYGFPRENVCLLLDADATTERFQRAFDQVLVQRARPGDLAVLYFSGHGSQTRDRNRDEPDDWDETLLLHDSRTPGVRDLVDDGLNRMLAALAEKTPQVTVIIDSCTSATATRAVSSYRARTVPPQDEADAPGSTEEGGDGAADWQPADSPGQVLFAAAGDGTPALETEGRGVFTDALIQVLAQVGPEPLTYAQAARQIAPLVKSRSYQLPYFHGEMNRVVFGNETRDRPLGLEVREPGPPIELAGPPLAGLGVGAELRVYDGSVTGALSRDPGKAKATLVVESATGLTAKARVAAAAPNAPAIVRGDLAILVRPADSFARLTVRLRPPAEPGGLSAERAAAIRATLAENQDARAVLQLIEAGGEFEVGQSAGCMVIWGPEGRLRRALAPGDGPAAIVSRLWLLARQKALLALEGEGGADFRDNETLEVEAVEAPRSRQTQCARGTWVPAGPNREQVMPLCHKWNVRVRLARDARLPLLVGGLVLSSDGDMLGFPAAGRIERLRPGESMTFDTLFTATPPLDTQDYVIVFGTQETNPVAWHMLTTAAAPKAAPQGSRSGLARALERHLRPGTKGQTAETVVEDTTWTRSVVPLRVVANDGFAEARPGRPAARKEYTIDNFDIRPYLPDDPSTALHKVLDQGHTLATHARADGVRYKQHDWSGATDEENLRRGIDCSRSIWYAFTRAGLPYNRDDSYLSTAMMVGPSSRMADRFEACDGEPRIGDVLVYRDEARGVGHVVLVIDYPKRIAWGSHGWDGNVTASLPLGDTGVEYQLIKFKKDWERWDRPAMERKACWRYRAFGEEARTRGVEAGGRALADACNAGRSCGRP